MESEQSEPRVVVVQGGTSKWFKVAATCVALLVIGFLTLSQMFAWERVRAVRGDLDELQSVTFYSDSKNNCLALYRNDLTVAMGMAIAANNDLWISVATRPQAGDTPEERQAQADANAALGKTLAESNAPLLAAAEALSAYDRIDPPPDHCPHPDSQKSLFPPPSGQG